MLSVFCNCCDSATASFNEVPVKYYMKTVHITTNYSRVRVETQQNLLKWNLEEKCTDFSKPEVFAFKLICFRDMHLKLCMHEQLFTLAYMYYQ